MRAVACDVERIRELAKTTMPGGWHAATKDDEYISQLYKNAAAIAAVRLGVVQEAFSQVEHSLLAHFVNTVQWIQYTT